MSEQNFGVFLRIQQQLARAQRERALVRNQRLAEKTRAEAQENALHWAALEARIPGHSAARFVRLALPSGRRRQANLPQRKRSSYRDHLNRIIAEAMASPRAAASPADDTLADPSASLAGHLCGACAGGCCNAGGDRAFLTAETIRRFMASQPQLRPREVLAAYLGRLPWRAQHRSCVNHTEHGCALPREMRSDTCNRWLCQPQQTLRDTGPVAGAVVVVRRECQWTKDDPNLANEVIWVALVTAAGITPLAAAA